MSSSGTGSSSIPRIMVFRPTMEEFKNFSEYIKKIESMGAHKAGLAKIIPPEGWCPRKNGYDDIDRLVIPSPITQFVSGRQGMFQQLNIQRKPMTVREFKKLAEDSRYRTPPHFDYEDLERKYWKNVTYNAPIYGADVSGSLYDDDVDEFNIQRLGTILDMVKLDYEIQIEGVNTAYLYFGMWKTTFAWHTEDMDLYSINYLHFGAPKSWYVVPPEHGRRLERLAANVFNSSYNNCPAFLRHKMTVISPQILKNNSIPFNKITQEPGEFMITFPFGYHSGFNHGYNCAESTNFALERWIEYGKRAVVCTCRKDCVKICMDVFVRKYQPDRYELWKNGKDFGTHPEDPTRHYAAPPPKKLELALAAQREERKKARAESVQKMKRHPISKLEKNYEKYEVESVSKESEDSDTKETEIYDVNDIEAASSFSLEISGFNSPLKMDEIKDDLQHISDSQNEVLSPVQEKEIASEHSIHGGSAEAKTLEKFAQLEPTGTTQQMHVTKKKCVKKKPKNNLNKKASKTNIHEASLATNEVNDVPHNFTSVKKCAKKSSVVRQPIEVTPVLVRVEKIKKSMINKQLGISSDRKITDKDKLSTSFQMQQLVEKSQDSSHLSNKQKTTMNQSSSLYDNSTLQNNEVSILSNDLLTKFPSFQQAISNGTLALRYTVPVNLPHPSPPSNLNVFNTAVANKSNTHSLLPHSGKTSDPAHIYSIQPNVPVSYGVPNKPSTSTASAISSPGGTWKCETNGLKLRLLNQVEASVSTSSKICDSIKDKCTIIPKQFCMTLCDSHTLSTISSATHSPSSIVSESKEKKSEIVSSQSDKSKERRRHRKDSRSSTSKSIKAASETIGNWAQPILPLWQHRDFSFEEEKKFNLHCSSIEPHCSICLIFTPSTVSKDYPVPLKNIPPSSKVKMPSFCFGNSLDNQCILDANPLYSRDGTSPLLVCSNCKLCVHATCYGITMLQMGPWVCSRCMSNAEQAECCLCVLRGGALKPTTDGRWAHILCAILIPEASFENVVLKEPINVTKLTVNRQRLKCKYCFKSIQNEGILSGACVQCLSGKCYLPFHVTCGHMAGVVYEANDWPEPINIMCTRHTGGRRKPQKRNYTDVKVGDKVLAKYKNKRYYWVEVKHIYNQEYYSVLFEDNSTSTNTLPEDVVYRENTPSGCPLINEKIRVKWTDDKIYNAIFKGSRSCEIYVVEFDDGTVYTQERFQIYAADENLPRDVISKLSYSTERRHVDNFKHVVEGKRVRVHNSKYLSET